MQAAINAAGNLLPADLPAPPIYAKVNPADAPILTLALTSKTLPLHAGAGPRRHEAGAEDLAAAGRRPRQHQRRPAPGGARPGRSAQARRLRPQSSTICAPRSATPTSTRPRAISTGRSRAYTINANDQLKSADDYRSLIIAYKNGAPVRLSDVATVVDGAENNKLGAWMNTTPAIIVNVQRQPGANVIEVVDRIKALLPQLAGGAARARSTSPC